MNLLVAEMRRTLKELDLGLKGELTITSDMEDLSDSLFFDQARLLSPVIVYLFYNIERCHHPGPSWHMPLSMVFLLGMQICFLELRS